MEDRFEDTSNLDRLRELRERLETAEQELVKRDALLAAIVENANDAIIARDLDSRVIAWNKAAERIYGYSAEEMIGSSIYRIVPEDRIKEHELWIEKAKRGKGTGPLRTLRCCKNGDLIPIVITVSPIIARNGEVLGASAIEHRDISHE